MCDGIGNDHVGALGGNHSYGDQGRDALESGEQNEPDPLRIAVLQVAGCLSLLDQFEDDREGAIAASCNELSGSRCFPANRPTAGELNRARKLHDAGAVSPRGGFSQPTGFFRTLGGPSRIDLRIRASAAARSNGATTFAGSGAESIVGLRQGWNHST